MPAFSILIPSYNHARFLEERIESILYQTVQDFEIIVIDDASTDNSAAVLEQYQNHPKFSHIIVNKQNSGSPFGVWRQGLALATGHWVWIAESDDIAEPVFLEEALRAIQNYPNVDIFYCDSYVLDENGKQYAEKFSERKNRVFKTNKWSNSYFKDGITEVNESLKYDCTINNMSSAVIRLELARENAGGIHEFYFHGDWYFLLRTTMAGNIYYCQKPLNHYRIYQKSHSSGVELVTSRKECFRILKLLLHNNRITDKKKMIDYFTFNSLAFGILEDGPKKAWRILRYYFKTDFSLAARITAKITTIKIFRKKSNYFEPETIWGMRE